MKKDVSKKCKSKKLLKQICGILIAILCGTAMLSCSKTTDEDNGKKLKVGDTGDYEYEGATFGYEIQQSRAYITKVTVKEDGRLILPEKIGGFDVKGMNFDALKECKEKVKDVVWSENWTEAVPASLFADCVNLESADLKNVKVISLNLFKGCKKLSVVKMNMAEEIQNYAFSGCTGLVELNMGKIESIGTNAFWDCTSLSKIDMSNLKSIGDRAFANCTSLTDDITFKYIELKNMGEKIFEGCTGLAGKTIKLESNQTFIPSGVYSTFEGLKANVIVNGFSEYENFALTADFERSYDEYCSSYYENGGLQYVEKEKLNVSDEVYLALLQEMFDGKEFKRGEVVISRQQLAKWIGCVIEDGTETSAWPIGGLNATKYRILNHMLELFQNKTLQYTTNEWQSVFYFQPADFNVDVVNTAYDVIKTYIEVYKAGDGSIQMVYLRVAGINN